MTAYYNENDPYAAQWLRNLIAAGHIPAGEVDDRSILDVRADDLDGYDQCHWFAGIGGWPRALELAGWTGPVWTGSCPCQPLSSAGQRKGHADSRHLWPAFHALIAECRPATVVGEQVASKDGREWLAGVRADLEHLGYAVGAADLPAAGVGAPHIRQRLFWVADSTGAGWAEGLRDVRGGVERSGAAQFEQLAGCGGPVRGLAESDGPSRRQLRLQPLGRNGARHAETSERPAAGGLADAADARRDDARQHDGRPSPLPARPVECGAAGGLADAGISGGRRLAGEQPGRRGIAADNGGLGLALGPRLEEQRGHAGIPCGPPDAVEGQAAQRADARTGGLADARDGGHDRGIQPVAGPGPGARPDWQALRQGEGNPWDAAVWLGCLDGKARRAEPGIFPLAHGITNRVGRLRAYGNAIVPQAAAAFVSAFMATR